MFKTTKITKTHLIPTPKQRAQVQQTKQVNQPNHNNKQPTTNNKQSTNHQSNILNNTKYHNTAQKSQ